MQTGSISPVTSRSHRARAALAHLPEVDPALASLAIWCAIRDAATPTTTRGDTILIGPEFADLPLRGQLGVLGHHILHVSFRHSARMKSMRQRMGASFQPDLFNLAADGLVNAYLDAADHPLPPDSARLADLLSATQCADLTNEISQWDVERLYLVLSEQADNAENASRSDGFTRDLEPSDNPDTSVEDAEWQGRLAQATNTQRTGGRGVALVLAGFGDLPQVRTPWETHLRNLVTKTLQHDPQPSFRRPHNAWIAADALARREGQATPAFQPGTRYLTERARIVVALDTSGSIPSITRDLFAAELCGIANRTGGEIVVLLFDETVYARLTPQPHDLGGLLRTAEAREGGGTSFVDVLEIADQADPSVIVVLTDLDGPMGVAPHAPVIWAATEPPRAAPPFGTVLILDR